MKIHFNVFTVFTILVLGFCTGAFAAILPDKDPDATGDQVKLKSGMENKHPRILITADKIKAIKDYYNSPKCPYKSRFQEMVQGCGVPQDRKTSTAWGQEQGLFRMPTIALNYVLTGDKSSLDKCKQYLEWLAQTADWTDGGEPPVGNKQEDYDKVMEKFKKFGSKAERNSDTTASFTMVGAAIIWDWTYNELDPNFREYFRKVLFEHCRAMYYGGHMGKNPGGNYWRGVPMYNHRWFRDWGWTLAMSAICEGKPEEQWLLQKLMA